MSGIIINPYRYAVAGPLSYIDSFVSTEATAASNSVAVTAQSGDLVIGVVVGDWTSGENSAVFANGGTWTLRHNISIHGGLVQVGSASVSGSFTLSAELGYSCTNRIIGLVFRNSANGVGNVPNATSTWGADSISLTSQAEGNMGVFAGAKQNGASTYSFGGSPTSVFNGAIGNSIAGIAVYTDLASGANTLGGGESATVSNTATEIRA
jgi:hypothetical protein